MRQMITFLVLSIIVLWGAESMVVGKSVIAYSLESEIPRVTMNLKALKDAGNRKDKQSIVIEIDDNKSLTFIPKRFNAGKKDSDFTWMGKTKDGKAKAILSVRNGIMFGTITSKEGKYKLYPENDHFKVIKVDPDMVIPFHVDTVMEPERTMMPVPELKQEEESVQGNEAAFIELQEFNDAVQASEPIASDSVVTLLVYYTQALEDEYGINTEAMIQANLDLAKDAYIDSDTEINLQVAILKKVPTGSLLSAADTTDLSDLLDKLSADGLVRYERQVYNADAVTVFSKYPDNGAGCGLASVPTSTTSTLVEAYSAVFIKPVGGSGYYCSDLSFAHELGHNFGCFHDNENVSGGVPMYVYAYGYDVVNEFGTIMSYDGPEISFFSNPSITYNTNAIGDASTADNARTIRENQGKMADNSDQISEVLESSDNDILNDYAISGNLNNVADRDGYIIWLEGNTRFMVDNTSYSNNPFFLNIYNEKTHVWINSFNDVDKTIVLPKGKYRVSVAFTNDATGTYYDLSTIGYTINITTEYVQPIFNPAMPSIINYMLN